MPEQSDQKVEEIYFKDVELYQFIYNKLLFLFADNKELSLEVSEQIFQFMYEDMGKEEEYDKFFKSKSTRENEALEADEKVDIVTEKDIKEFFEMYIETPAGKEVWEDYVLDNIIIAVNQVISEIEDKYFSEEYADKYKRLFFKEDKLKDTINLSSKSAKSLKNIGMTVDELVEYILANKKDLRISYIFYDYPSNVAKYGIELFKYEIGVLNLRLPIKMLKILSSLDLDSRNFIDKKKDTIFDLDGIFTLDFTDKGFIYYIRWTPELEQKLVSYLEKIK